MRDLGSTNHLTLRNHGLLTVGTSVAAAFLPMHRFEAACMVQVRAQAADRLVPIPQQVQELAASQLGEVRGNLGVNRLWPGLLRRLERRFPGYDA